MKMKNFLVYLLVAVLTVSLCSPAVAYADEEENEELKENYVWIDSNNDSQLQFNELNLPKLVSYTLSSMGIWLDEGYENILQFCPTFNNWLTDGSNWIWGTLKDGLVTFSNWVAPNALSIANEIMSQYFGVQFYPSQSGDKLYYYNNLGLSYSVSSYNSLLSDRYFETGIPVLYTSTYIFASLDSNIHNNLASGSYILIAENGVIDAYVWSNGFTQVTGTRGGFYFSTSSMGFTSFRTAGQSPCIATTNGFLGLVGASCKVFSSVNYAIQYHSNNSGVYVSNNAHGGGGGSIPLNTLNNTNWTDLNSTTHDSIGNSISNGLTFEEVQDIVDDFSDEVTDAIGSVTEGQITTNNKLEEILNKLTQDGERQSSWLSKIYTLLEEHLPIISGSGGGSGGGSGAGASSDQLEEIIKLLEKNVNTLEDIEKDTGQIKALLAIDTASNFFELLSVRVGQSTETLKTKFPTSIPWDVMAVVGFMAEEPEPPIYDIPIRVNSLGIEESIHIDLSENSKTSNFSSISKISRSMLTITFIIYLMIFTRNFTGKDD